MTVELKDSGNHLALSSPLLYIPCPAAVDLKVQALSGTVISLRPSRQMRQMETSAALTVRPQLFLQSLATQFHFMPTFGF